MPVGRKSWEVMLRLYQLRAWRIVEAPDATGNRCPCLLIPMACNGINLSENGQLPYMRFIAPPVTSGLTNEGFFRGLIPIICKDNHTYMVDNGYIAEDEKYWAKGCGGIRESSFARSEKDRPYMKKKKEK